MWVLPEPKPFKIAGANVEKQLEDLTRGEIFSLNAKSKRFVLANIDIKKKPNGEILANELLADNKVGQQFALPYSDYKERNVAVWGEVGQQEEKPEVTHEELDRVKMNGVGVEGTVLMIDSSQPEIQATVLWDKIVDGKWITKAHAHEIERLGTKATGKLLKRAQDAKPIVKDRQEDHEALREEQSKRVIQNQLTEEASRREKYQKFIDEEQNKLAKSLAEEVINKNAPEFKSIVQAGVLTVTSGENNYEINVISEILNGYMDHIMNKVAPCATSEMRVPVTVEVMKLLGSTMVDNYFLTREGYITRNNGKWLVHNRAGKTIRVCGSKKQALTQLRRTEWRKRRGIEE